MTRSLFRVALGALAFVSASVLALPAAAQAAAVPPVPTGSLGGAGSSGGVPAQQLGPWHRDGVTYQPAVTTDEGLATNGGSIVYRGVVTIPPDLLARGWTHVGDPDAYDGYVLDAFEGHATEKLYSLTAPDGSRTDYVHPLAPGEAMNNSFTAVAPGGQWFVSGEYGDMNRLLVFAMPRFNPAAPPPGGTLPLAAQISLDHTVRNIQGCDFASPTTLLCSSNDPGGLWPTPRPLLRVDLSHPIDGTATTGHVTSLGELPQQSICPGTFESEGIDVQGDQMLVEMLEPVVCNFFVTDVYRYTR